MEYYTNYIGYKSTNKKIGVPGAVTLATGGAAFPVTAAIDIVLAAIPFIISAIGRGKPNPNDWKGWVALDNEKHMPIGTNAVSWIINDGQSIENEALNILQYIKNYGTQDILTYNKYYMRTITANDLANKLRRGGFSAEADQLIKQANIPAPLKAINETITNLTQSPSKLILYAGIGLGLYLILKK
jgi:hypothetical protein